MGLRPMMRAACAAVIAAGLVATATTAGAQQKRVVLGANPPGSLFYALCAGLASVMTKHSPYKVDVFPEGSQVYLPMLASKEVDIGLINPIEAGFAYRGEARYKQLTGGKGFDMRTIMTGAPMAVSLIATKESGVKTLKDIKGKRVVADYGTFFAANVTRGAAFANAGYTLDDIKLVRVTNISAGVRALIEGRAEVAVAAVGMGIVKELDAKRGARYLAIDTSQAAMARARKAAPGITSIRQPPTTGVEQPTNLFSYAITMISRPGLDNETVYQLVKAVWNNTKELAPIHPRFRGWTQKRMAQADIVAPYHPGAIKFFKEVGAWNDALAAKSKEVARN